jgi:putative Holliday junction resolvase
MRILGIDLGEKRIGLAISDEGGKIACGFGVIDRKGDLMDRLKEIVSSKDVKEIVIGLPRSMDGDIGKQGKRVSCFAKKVAQSLGVPIKLWDERLTTSSSERLLIQADLSRKKRRRVVDKLSATLILQNYLDYLYHKT